MCRNEILEIKIFHSRTLRWRIRSGILWFICRHRRLHQFGRLYANVLCGNVRTLLASEIYPESKVDSVVLIPTSSLREKPIRGFVKAHPRKQLRQRSFLNYRNCVSSSILFIAEYMLLKDIREQRLSNPVPQSCYLYMITLTHMLVLLGLHFPLLRIWQQCRYIVIHFNSLTTVTTSDRTYKQSCLRE